jgi:lipopolysaccharide export LptBFGC system permease protein LptF
MQEAFASGAVIDIILGLMALEAMALFALRRRLGRGPSRLEILVSLAAGFFLMIALRTALTDGPWPIIAAALAGSLVAHVADLWLRWSRTVDSVPDGAS